MWNMKHMIMLVITVATITTIKGLKKKSGSPARKTFDIFTTKDSYTRNITNSTEGTCATKILVRHIKKLNVL